MQFALTPAKPRPKSPAWIEQLGEWVEWLLRPVGRFFAWLFSWLPDAAWARYLLYLLLAAGAAGFAAIRYLNDFVSIGE